MPRRARAAGQLGFAGAGVEAWAPWLSSWLADGRELASGMGRGGPEWERVVLRSGGHALIAPPAAPGTNAMGHRRTRELCRGLLRCREPREPWEPFRGSGSHPNFTCDPPTPRLPRGHLTALLELATGQQRTPKAATIWRPTASAGPFPAACRCWSSESSIVVDRNMGDPVFRTSGTRSVVVS